MANKILKKKAWSVFALYIKLRDSNADGVCYCCTCGKELPFDDGDCQAGHFVAGRGGNVLFNEHIVHSQCAKCNFFNSGEQGRYALFMKRKYGYSDDDIEGLLNERGKIKKITDADLVELIKSLNSVITITLATKFNKNDNIQKRVAEKIKTFGIKKILEAE